MLFFSKIKEIFTADNARNAKVQQHGTKTAPIATAFGDDSHPTENMTAIFAETEENGEAVIVGYINEKIAAEVGEKRLFSLNSMGAVSSFVWMKNNGKLQLNGDAHTAVRYSPLNSSMNTLSTDINAELTKIQTAIAAVGGAYVPAPINIDVSGAESEDVELK